MTALRARWSRSFNLAAAAFVPCIALLRRPRGRAGRLPMTARLGREINILGYDRIWEGGQNAPFRLDNLTAIKKAGFAHVRINFFGFKFMGRGNVLDEIVLRRLDAVIEEILARKLVPIVDEHDTHLCQRDVSKCGEKLRAFWRQIAERYAGRYPGLVFEVLNEPGGEMRPPAGIRSSTNVSASSAAPTPNGRSSPPFSTWTRSLSTSWFCRRRTSISSSRFIITRRYGSPIRARRGLRRFRGSGP